MSKLSERRREIQAMDMATAQDELKTLRRRLFELRLQKERGEVKNNRLFPQTKADIARLMHHLGELNSAAELEAAGMLSSDSSETPATTAAQTATDEEA